MFNRMNGKVNEMITAGIFFSKPEVDENVIFNVISFLTGIIFLSGGCVVLSLRAAPVPMTTSSRLSIKIYKTLDYK